MSHIVQDSQPSRLASQPTFWPAETNRGSIELIPTRNIQLKQKEKISPFYRLFYHDYLTLASTGLVFRDLAKSIDFHAQFPLKLMER